MIQPLKQVNIKFKEKNKHKANEGNTTKQKR